MGDFRIAKGKPEILSLKLKLSQQRVIQTTRALFTIDQKGIFEKEIDKAVAEKQIDFAVHSLKDVPSDISELLTIACVPKRESANDVLITKEGYNLKTIPAKCYCWHKQSKKGGSGFKNKTRHCGKAS